MSYLFTSRHNANAVNFCLLLLRLVFAGFMMHHGFEKLTHFAATSEKMPMFLGMSRSFTTSLVIFAEFFCSLFLIIGLLTRLACIPLLICMGYIVFVINRGAFMDSEMAALFFGAFLCTFIAGPGRYSVDGLIGKK